MHYEILKNRDLEVRGDSRELIVFVHGHGGDLFEDVKQAARDSRPDADLLCPTFDAGAFSRLDPFDVASELEYLVRETFDAAHGRAEGRAYDGVILVGFSLGALLLRKAYLYGLGYPEDRPGTLPGAASADVREWAAAVDRIILFAGLNRGFRLTPKPKDMRLWKWLKIMVGYWIARLTGTGTLLRSAFWGAPFVAGVRLQWVVAHRDARVPLPPVYQLHGTEDDIVTAADDTDLKVSPDFVYFAVQNAGHREVLEFADGTPGAYARTVFKALLAYPIRPRSEPNAPPEDIVTRFDGQQSVAQTAAKHVVFVMHGIRDDGYWTMALADEIEAAAPDVKAVTSSYGRFTMVPFLLHWARNKKVRWFMDEYTEKVAEYAHPDTRVSYCGHSNGTYVLARAMELYPALKVHRVYFAGSVVRRNYEWETLRDQGRVTDVRNDLGSADAVVGWFPRLFEFLPVEDIGSAGLRGFEEDWARRGQKIFRGGHGAAIVEANFPSIARYITSGARTYDGQLLVDAPNGFVLLVSNVCFLVWAALLSALALGAYGVLQLAPGRPALQAGIEIAYSVAVATILFFV